MEESEGKQMSYKEVPAFIMVNGDYFMGAFRFLTLMFTCVN